VPVGQIAIGISLEFRLKSPRQRGEKKLENFVPTKNENICAQGKILEKSLENVILELVPTK